MSRDCLIFVLSLSAFDVMSMPFFARFSSSTRSSENFFFIDSKSNLSGRGLLFLSALAKNSFFSFSMTGNSRKLEMEKISIPLMARLSGVSVKVSVP